MTVHLLRQGGCHSGNRPPLQGGQALRRGLLGWGQARLCGERAGWARAARDGGKVSLRAGGLRTEQEVL